jgi:hypothetical protein
MGNLFGSVEHGFTEIMQGCFHDSKVSYLVVEGTLGVLHDTGQGFRGKNCDAHVVPDRESCAVAGAVVTSGK